MSPPPPEAVDWSAVIMIMAGNKAFAAYTDLLFMDKASSEVSNEPAQMYCLAISFAASIHKVRA